MSAALSHSKQGRESSCNLAQNAADPVPRKAGEGPVEAYYNTVHNISSQPYVAAYMYIKLTARLLTTRQSSVSSRWTRLDDC